MRKSIRLFLISLLFLSVAVVMTGCGGGGSSGSASTTGETGTISGTVGGTTVIAVNTSGDIVASDDTAGKTADADGNYSFTLKNIPAGENIRVYLIEEGGVYPMYFDTNNNGNTNVFSLASPENINLGFVGRHNGQAVPEHNPTGYSGVSAGAAVAGIPSSISNPQPPSSASLSDLVKHGKGALSNLWFKKAKNYLEVAVDKISSSNHSEDADSARFFYALASLPAFSTDFSSGGNSSDMNSMGDMLDKTGCTGSRGNFDDLNCPKTLPATTPSGGDVQTFLYSQVKPKIEDAISRLDAITSSFSTTWIEPFGKKTVDVDYGDVLTLKAALESIAATIDYQYAYNLDANIASEVNNPNNDIQTFLTSNSSFLTYDTNHSSALDAAKAETVAMLGDLHNAIDVLSNETPNQKKNDLITLPNSMTPQDITNTETQIAAIKNCIDTGDSTCTVWNHGTPADTSDDVVLNMIVPFSGISIRDLLPQFNGNTPGYFPDPTLDGFLVQGIDINTDANSDGIPDILQTKK